MAPAAEDEEEESRAEVVRSVDERDESAAGSAPPLPAEDNSALPADVDSSLGV